MVDSISVLKEKTNQIQREKSATDGGCVLLHANTYICCFDDFSKKKNPLAFSDTESQGEFFLYRLACSHPVC